MKKIAAVILALVISAGCFFTVSYAADSVVLAGEGVQTTIVTPGNPSEQTQYAAEALQKYIYEITGTEPSVSSRSGEGAEIVLEYNPDIADGAYSVKENSGSLIVSGGGKRGVIYGVYAFLEKVCGCRYYTNEKFFIPQADSISVPAGFTLEYTPYFEYTETDWSNGKNPEFSVANGISGGSYCRKPERMGGNVEYISWLGHTLTNQFCSSATYFESHPEYFALHDGVRTPNQLCLTNPDTLRIVTGEILSLLEEKHSPEEELQIVSVTQHDNGDFCECPECSALDEANGSHAGTMVTFTNAVAEAVERAGYGNVAIDTFAYQYTRKTPSAVAPRDNVIIRLCSIECCFGHALDDPSCPENAKFMDDLVNWSKICRRLYIWDYGTNYSEYMSFFPNFRVMQKNMQIFCENNVRGIYGEGNLQMDLCNAEFCDLRLYLQAKLMQDPYMDFDAEMNGFLEFFYGSGWKSIRDFILTCCDKGLKKDTHVGIFERNKGSLPGLKSKDIALMDAMWEAALEGAGTQEQADNVRRSGICWRYWKCSNSKGEFSYLHTPYQRMKANDELYLDITGMGITHIGETNRKRELSECYALHLLRIPFCWSTLYDNAFWDYISPAVVRIYEFLGRVESVFGF